MNRFCLGTAVQLIEVEGEDHWLSGATTRLATLQALDRSLTEAPRAVTSQPTIKRGCLSASAWM
jgi:hypothetical protein